MRKKIECEEVNCDMCGMKLFLKPGDKVPLGWSKTLVVSSESRRTVDLCQICTLQAEKVTNLLGFHLNRF